MTESPRAHVLIAGVTTRALAVSAVRAGYLVTAVDAFGDLDLRAAAEVITVRPRFDPNAAASSARQSSAALVAYTSNLENHPKAVERLARGRTLLGNSPATLARVRNPFVLARFLRQGGFLAPLTRATAPAKVDDIAWLLKPRKSGGGHGVTVWEHKSSVPRGKYLQERITGIPGSAIFAANGRQAVVLGLSRQLVGDSRFGAHSFRYCGSLVGGALAPVFPQQPDLLRTASALATEVTREFGLIGLNGIDFVARQGVPYPIEINPRCSASMELLERAHPLPLFELHARACRGILPSAPEWGRVVEGKAIVFARQDVVPTCTDAWVGNHSVADVPPPKVPILNGAPICTVFARGSTPAKCIRRLVERAEVVYRRVGAPGRRAA
jgi:uncharacterized protein